MQEVSFTTKDLNLLQFNEGRLRSIKFKYSYYPNFDRVVEGVKQESCIPYPSHGGVILDFIELKSILDNMEVNDITGIIVFGSVVNQKKKTYLKSTWFGWGKDREETVFKEPEDLDLLILTKSEHDIKIKSAVQMYQYHSNAYEEWESYRTVHDGLDLFIMTEEQFQASGENFREAIFQYGKLLAGKMPCKK